LFGLRGWLLAEAAAVPEAGTNLIEQEARRPAVDGYDRPYSRVVE
jgi:hypothetical protein